MTWVFQMGTSADYGTEAIRVYVCKTKNNRIVSTYQCTAIQALDLTLSAGQNVGQGSVTLGNADGSLFQDPAAQPHAMDILHVRGRNKTGTWGPMWTGYIDTVHQVDDPTAGRTALLTATSPQKIFEIRLQLPGDVASLAFSSLGGLSGSAILVYICTKTSVNYPGALKDLAQAIGYEPSLAPHLPSLAQLADADTGIANWQGIAQAVFLDPAQQSWEAVLEGLLADSGVQWFFDEMGNLYWQQPKYITGKDGLKPVILTEDDLFSRDLAESDQGVVTSVTVRYGIIELNAISVTKNTDGDTGLGGGIGQLISGKSSNPIRDQLGTRVVVIYANWIQYPDAAANLANLLLQMYASNVLVGTIIIPPDPTITIGSLVQLPTGRRITGSDFAEQGIYYVAAIEYTLQWGSSYVMVLGLQYGRGINTGWAYPGAQPYPQTSLPPSEALNSNIISFAPGSTTTLANVFTLIDRPGLLSNEVIADPRLFSPGTVLMIRAVLPNNIAGPGSPVGPSNQGTYTVVAGTPGQGYTLYLSDTGGVSQGTVTLVQGAAAAPSFSGDASGSSGSSNDAGGGPSPGPAITQSPLPPTFGGTPVFTSLPFAVPFSFTQSFGVKGPSSGEVGYCWPAPPPGVYAPFNVTHFHTGVDIAVGSPNLNAPIYSVCAGVVAGVMQHTDVPIPEANNLGDYRCNIAQSPCIGGCNFLGFGNNVVINTGDYLVHYAHMSSTAVVVGQAVYAGTKIGDQGSTVSDTAEGTFGYTTGPHLHFGVWDKTTQAWVDPTPFFTAGKLSLGVPQG